MISTPLQEACDNAIRASRRGDTRAAIGLARHAYRLARQETADGELEALNALALCQAANGSFIESIATAIDAFGLARQHGHRRGAAYALTTMAGSASFILDADAVVLDMLSVCTDEARALDDDALLVRVFNTYGLVYGNLHRWQDAVDAYDAGLALLAKGNPRAALITPDYLVMGNSAFLAVQKARAAMPAAMPAEFDARAADADALIARVLAISAREKNIDSEARLLYSLGQLRGLEGRHAEALEAFGGSLARARQIRHNPRLIDGNLEVSKIHAALGDFERALAALEEAFEIADGNRPTPKVAQACEGMAAMYAALGRDRDSAHHAARAERERESFARENDHAVRDLTAFWRTIVADRETAA